MKELNKDLSHKLEAQTQRMELLTAQSMANAIIPARQPDSHLMHENTPYADEGDEVYCCYIFELRLVGSWVCVGVGCIDFFFPTFKSTQRLSTITPNTTRDYLHINQRHARV